jgi:hypothetical protein
MVSTSTKDVFTPMVPGFSEKFLNAGVDGGELGVGREGRSFQEHGRVYYIKRQVERIKLF